MNFSTSIAVDPTTAVSVAPAPPLVANSSWRSGSSNSPGIRGYNGGRYTQQMRDWLTAHMSGDMAINHGWDNLTQRARDLVRNEPYAAEAVRRIAENVIGPAGILSESEIELEDGTLDDETGHEVDTWFNRWAADEADAEGEMDFAEMQSLALRETPEVGESLLVRVNDEDPKRIIPLCYQLFEPEQININMDKPLTDGGRVKRGIEFDKFGRRVAYHFWSEHPYDLLVTATDTVRIPAERVIHFYEKLRPSQTRGVTWFAPILQCMRDLSQYVGSEMTAAKIGSFFTVAVKRAVGVGTGMGFGDSGSSSDANGNPLEELGPGIIADLAAGDSIDQINPARPNARAEPWIKLILESMANGMGMTYLGLTGDVSRASFSSARFAQNKDKVFWRTIQGRFGRKTVLRIRQEVVRQLVALGRVRSITPTLLAKSPYRFLSTRLLPPGWEEIQSDAEVNSAIARIQAGLSTLQEECAGRGKNYRRILKQRAREMVMVENLGLDLTTNYPGRVSISGTDAGDETPVAPALDE